MEDTDFLENAGRGKIQGSERDWARSTHFLVIVQGRKSQGQQNKAREKVAHTSWKVQTEGQVMTQTESERVGERHPPTVEHKEGEKSGQQKKESEGHSLPGEHRRIKLWQQTKAKELGALTPWRTQREGPVRTAKESVGAKSTCQLQSAEGGTS